MTSAFVCGAAENAKTPTSAISKGLINLFFEIKEEII
jgi:hypothetical protein